MPIEYRRGALLPSVATSVDIALHEVRSPHSSVKYRDMAVFMLGCCGKNRHIADLAGRVRRYCRKSRAFQNRAIAAGAAFPITRRPCGVQLAVQADAASFNGPADSPAHPAFPRAGPGSRIPPFPRPGPGGRKPPGPGSRGAHAETDVSSQRAAAYKGQTQHLPNIGVSKGGHPLWPPEACFPHLLWPPGAFVIPRRPVSFCRSRPRSYRLRRR